MHLKHIFFNSFQCLVSTSPENIRNPDDFRRYRKRTFAWKGQISSLSNIFHRKMLNLINFVKYFKTYDAQKIQIKCSHLCLLFKSSMIDAKLLSACRVSFWFKLAVAVLFQKKKLIEFLAKIRSSALFSCRLHCMPVTLLKRPHHNCFSGNCVTLSKSKSKDQQLEKMKLRLFDTRILRHRA